MRDKHTGPVRWGATRTRHRRWACCWTRPRASRCTGRSADSSAWPSWNAALRPRHGLARARPARRRGLRRGLARLGHLGRRRPARRPAGAAAGASRRSGRQGARRRRGAAAPIPARRGAAGRTPAAVRGLGHVAGGVRARPPGAGRLPVPALGQAAGGGVAPAGPGRRGRGAPVRSRGPAPGGRVTPGRVARLRLRGGRGRRNFGHPAEHGPAGTLAARPRRGGLGGGARLRGRARGAGGGRGAAGARAGGRGWVLGPRRRWRSRPGHAWPR